MKTLLISPPSRIVSSERLPVRDLVALKLALLILRFQEAWSSAMGKLDKKLSPYQRKWVYSLLLILGLGLAIRSLIQGMDSHGIDLSTGSPATIALPPLFPGDPIVFPDSLSTTFILNPNCYE